MTEPSERITVSRETLRAELAGLELRLVDRLTYALEHKADRALLESTLERVKALELSRAERAHMAQELVEIQKTVKHLERFRWAVPSTAVISLAITVGLLIQQHFVG